jgi:putative hemolysin
MIEILLVLLLLAVNGIFALAEIAVVSARRVRLQQRAARGDRGAREALELAAHPTRFLSTVQIGITLVGVLAGAFGGATLAARLAARLRAVPALAEHADGLALAMVVGAITYLSLVIGELVPKRVALSDPERIAALVARPMRLLSRAASPLVRLLTGSTNVIVRLLGIRETAEPPVTAEELVILLAQGERAGVFEASEQDIVENALRLDDVRIAALATPRPQVVWLDLAAPVEQTLAAIAASPHAYFPVARGNLDAVEGVVRGRDVLARRLSGEALDLAALARPPLFLPETRSALDALAVFRAAEHKIAIAVDEFGGVAGLLTLTDVLRALVGELRGLGAAPRPAVEELPDGGWSLSGRLPIGELCDLLGWRELPGPSAGFDTLAGLVLSALGRVPEAGADFERSGHAFEVEAMEGRRVDRVRVRPLAARPDDATSLPPG